ncbi:Cupin domain-containing protein [Catalinimonas alkaloidigena]|uniref:Cupin domain-containing protein n=1 Tax=Catalinimonas alkaloidigena TaxID=1075417 RepID=A0A1G9SDT0_9BACT|nr:cupin domain-containing protein [Catalinimonas alkaloidigena]SDM33551.1 Cupin domain-containing protein [Catalinimonas alkaloidigena]
MKRNQFVRTLLAAFPATAYASRWNFRGQNAKGFKVAAGEGRYHGHILLKGVNANVLDVKISGKDTAGALAVFEQTSRSPGRGTPLHVHLEQDEIFYVLAGEYRFRVGDDVYALQAGDSIFLPRRVPHAWTQVSARGKMTVLLQPAGQLEEFFVTLASLQYEPTPDEIARIFADHGMQVVGPPLSLD